MTQPSPRNDDPEYNFLLPLRIGFDLDGVLADMESELVRQADAIFGEAVMRRPLPGRTVSSNKPGPDPESRESSSASPPETPPIVKLHLTARQERTLWRHVATIENFWQSLDEIEPGAVSRLAEIAADRRWEIIFLTKRPRSAGATAQLQSQRWLESKGFVLPSVYVVQQSRGKIAAALGLDIVIDDRPENCLDVVVDSKARSLLIWRDEEKDLPVSVRRLGIGVFRSVAQCLDLLASVDSPIPHGPGVLARLRRMFRAKKANI